MRVCTAQIDEAKDTKAKEWRAATMGDPAATLDGKWKVCAAALP